MRIWLLRFSVLLILVIGSVLLYGFRLTFTPYGRMDYGAALVAKFLTVDTLTRLGNAVIDSQAKLIDEQIVLLEVGNSPEPLRRQDAGVPAEWGRIPIRIYRPQGAGPFPAMLWIHGGSWMTGSHYVTDGTVISLSSLLRIAVISVDYRLLPEHPFPAALDDCYRVLEWIAEQSEALNIDLTRLLIRGESAGGNLAAAVTLMARDRGGPKILFQMLHQPVVDLRDDVQWESRRKFGQGYFLEMGAGRNDAPRYVRNPKQQLNVYASPILADLANLPPALISVAEFDPLHDEGEAYALALGRAGVDVKLYESKGALHSLLGSPAKEKELLALERETLSAVLLANSFGEAGGLNPKISK